MPTFVLRNMRQPEEMGSQEHKTSYEQEEVQSHLRYLTKDYARRFYAGEIHVAWASIPVKIV